MAIGRRAVEGSYAEMKHFLMNSDARAFKEEDKHLEENRHCFVYPTPPHRNHVTRTIRYCRDCPEKIKVACKKPVYLYAANP
ncbi:hypothetical protein LCGC14_3034180 [marine sediment metagenome]|uniref:Uncharacterized protein n=1 Tax=marine sediment metagenome TaxID=412755 RepID=A0A0F8WS26_9ZZZZ